MADFHQAGVVTTLHRLEAGNVQALEEDLLRFAGHRRITLVLPALFAEFSRPAIWQIIERLRDVPYLDRLVMSLGKASREELVLATQALGQLPFGVRVIWNDGPAMQALYALLEDHGLSPGEDGKGRSCWIAFGYALQAGCEVIAVHDCDITTYSRELLARLCYPVVHPDFAYDFAKGYYARVAGRMHGRVTRLLVTPLIRALQRTIGPAPLLDYLGSFRYALSGEFAMKADLARVNRLPCNWGLEVGTLVEVYRRCGTRRVCQTEICNHYDHKHQALSAENPQQGLLKMCIDVTATLLGALADERVVLSGAASRQLVAAYRCAARDIIEQYRADAAINGLRFDAREEQHMVDVFAEAVRRACEHQAAGAIVPLMPTWDDVISAIPTFPSLLQQAVDEDDAVAVAA